MIFSHYRYSNISWYKTNVIAEIALCEKNVTVACFGDLMQLLANYSALATHIAMQVVNLWFAPVYS